MLREKIYIIIFESDTLLGKLFDLLLIASILISILVIMLESVESIHLKYGWELDLAEWMFTGFFCIEYFLRIYCHPQRRKYIFSFFGAIDFISILPTFVALAIPSAHYFLVFRIVRIVRVFRILKLMNYLGASNLLIEALRESKTKVSVFFIWVLCIIIISGSLMYVVEGSENGFTSIPKSIYWAIVTLTTVGYGDISPQTVLGQTIASFIMLSGYAILAVPTGIISSELTKAKYKKKVQCSSCGTYLDPEKCNYCFRCGEKLP